MDNPNLRPPLSEALFSDRKLFQSLSELYASKNFNRGVLFKNTDFQRQNKKTYVKKSKLQATSSAPTSPASSNSLKRPIDETNEVAIKQEADEGTSGEEKMLLSPNSSGDIAANCFNNININITNTSTNIVAREPRVNSLMTNLHRSASESALNTLSWISTSSMPNSPMMNISTEGKSSPALSKKRKIAGFSLDVNAKLDVTFEESIQGCKKMLEYDCYVMCDKCGGEARKDNNSNNNNNNNETVGCSQCNGMIWRTKKTFEVDIPPYGAKNGFKKTYKGLGSKGEDGAVGDLVVEFHVADHPFFRRNSDDDTVCDVHISVYQAVLGTKVQIPKLYGKDGEKIEVSIKAGIQPGTVIRMPTQGFTKSNCKKKRGDLFINILVDIPTHLTQQQKELFERLAVIDSMFDLHLQPSPPSSPVQSRETPETAEQAIPHALISLKGETK